MIIDTDYTSLSVIDENIRHYYSKDVRERVVGYTEPNEEGESSPIVESYTVIVLNQPDKVTYQDVEQRRSERKPWDLVVKPELERAIAWEEFCVNHNQYLDWKDALAFWEKEQPTEPVWDEGSGEYIDQVVSRPVRPLVDLSNRRSVYELKVEEYHADYEFFLGTYTDLYRDDLLVVIRVPDTQPKSDADIAEYHAELAIKTRFSAVYANIEYNGQLYQMGQGKDGIYGIDNFKNVLTSIVIDPSKEGETVHWITASNEFEPLSYSDIKAIIGSFNERQQRIFVEYSAWRKGDRLSLFTCS
ncbi:hypothetical protein ACH0R5_000620 [Vibrio vulnificus]